MSTYEQFLASKALGSAVGSTDLALVIAGKDNGGNAAPFKINSSGELVVSSSGGGGGDATAANQTTQITALGSLTETAPVSDTASSGLNGRLQRIAQRLSTLITSGLTLGASANEIGRTNIKHFNVAATGSGILIRPANTTAYSANDSVSDNATAGSVTALPVTVSDTNDDPVNIIEILLDTTDTGFANVAVTVHVFNSDPTASSGVVGGDNAAWSQKKAGWAGSFSGTMKGFSDGARGVLIPDGPTVKLMNVSSAGKIVWWQLQVLAAATPSANSTVFTPRFKGYQGRA
jgi:hypothetical protein